MAEYVVEWDGIAVEITSIADRYCYPEIKELRKKRRHERIVRCKDCIHHKALAYKDDVALVCMLRPTMAHRTTPDDFCSRGELPTPGFQDEDSQWLLR